MITHNLKEIIKGTAKITYVCAGKVYYEIKVDNTALIDQEELEPGIKSKKISESLYQLEINSLDEDWKTTYLYPEFKAITLMRWIRKGMEKNDGTFIQLK